MPYITIKQPPRIRQLTLEEMLSGETDYRDLVISDNDTNTVTRYVKNVSSEISSKFAVTSMLMKLVHFNKDNSKLIEADKRDLYSSFKIPKKTGGLRQIDAPCDELKRALYELKSIFESDLFTGGIIVYHHTSAYAYVKNRCALDAVKKHQLNNSKWFLKTDFSNFFGSTTLEYAYNMLIKIFPFSRIAELNIKKHSEDCADTTIKGSEELKKALSLCFLTDENGVETLPQGTPMSPLLTNIIMIPIDHRISNDLRYQQENFTYTRYSDDIQISSRKDFDANRVVEYINGVLKEFNAPFKIKPEKTRYGSSSGRNWNLGVMLNKDNEITIGHSKKKQFKAMLNNYINDKKKDVSWDVHDVQSLIGITNYYRMVERENIDHIIDCYNKKYKVDVMKMMKNDVA